MAGSAIYLDIDISDAKKTIDALRAVHTEHEMNQLLYRAFKRTGGRVKTILRQEIPQDYEVKASWVGSHVGSPRTTIGGGGMGVSCSIPIDGSRGSIGGRFKASGGAHGWNAARGKRYKINAKIVKGQGSTLPSEMSHQGRNPPFRNLGSSLGGATFTRTGKDRFPIARVVGLGVPQMPLNRSKEDVQEDIMETLMKRLEHEHAYLISRCR